MRETRQFGGRADHDDAPCDPARHAEIQRSARNLDCKGQPAGDTTFDLEPVFPEGMQFEIGELYSRLEFQRASNCLLRRALPRSCQGWLTVHQHSRQMRSIGTTEVANCSICKAIADLGSICTTTSKASAYRDPPATRTRLVEHT